MVGDVEAAGKEEVESTETMIDGVERMLRLEAVGWWATPPTASRRCWAGWSRTRASPRMCRCGTRPSARMEPCRALSSCGTRRPSHHCPQGHALLSERRQFTKPRERDAQADVTYRASQHDCTGCPMKQQCCPNTPLATSDAACTRTHATWRAHWPRPRSTSSPGEIKEGRDTVCPSQAHPQARSPALARPERCARRVLAGSNCSELATNGQEVVQADSTRSRLYGVEPNQLPHSPLVTIGPLASGLTGAGPRASRSFVGEVVARTPPQATAVPVPSERGC